MFNSVGYYVSLLFFCVVLSGLLVAFWLLCSVQCVCLVLPLVVAVDLDVGLLLIWMWVLCVLCWLEVDLLWFIVCGFWFGMRICLG